MNKKKFPISIPAVITFVVTLVLFLNWTLIFAPNAEQYPWDIIVKLIVFSILEALLLAICAQAIYELCANNKTEQTVEDKFMNSPPEEPEEEPEYEFEIERLTTMDKYQALEKLAELKDKGILSDDEFAAEKAKILRGGEAVNRPKPTYNAEPVQQPIVINNTNSNVNTVYSGMNAKNKWVALLLCIFLGFFGAHKFYEGKYLLGVVYIFTGGLFVIGVLVDFFAILFKPNPYYC